MKTFNLNFKITRNKKSNFTSKNIFLAKKGAWLLFDDSFSFPKKAKEIFSYSYRKT